MELTDAIKVPFLAYQTVYTNFAELGTWLIIKYL